MRAAGWIKVHLFQGDFAELLGEVLSTTLCPKFRCVWHGNAVHFAVIMVGDGVVAKSAQNEQALTHMVDAGLTALRA